jgi:hypothetical protein
MPTTPSNPKDEFASQISALRTQLDALEKDTRLTGIRDEVEDLQTTVHGLGQKVAGLRSRGFVFGNDFEYKASNFAEQWKKTSPGLLAQVNQEASRLQTAFAPLRTRGASLAAVAGHPAQARQILAQLKPQADALTSQVEAAERQLKGTYDAYKNQVNRFKGDLAEADWMLSQLAEASFQLLATEAGVRAVKAVWTRDGKEDKEDPDGILFLTDQRLIFEQKEEVATKKVLFIATEKQKIQKMLFEAPVALVEKIETSKKGVFKNEDHIEVHFAPGAPVTQAQFHIWENCAEWQALINRVRSGDIQKERAIPVDAAAAEKVRSAPSQCPGCGGNITQVILRGQDSVQCEFCGLVIRL